MIFLFRTCIKQKIRYKFLCFTLWDTKTTVWDIYFTVWDTNPTLWNREYNKTKWSIHRSIWKLYLVRFRLFLQTSFYYCRYAGCQRIIGNIFGYNTACCNDTTIANGHSRTYYHISTQPAVLTYRNGIGGFLFFTALHIIHGMLRCIELTMGTYQGVFSDTDIAGKATRLWPFWPK